MTAEAQHFEAPRTPLPPSLRPGDVLGGRFALGEPLASGAMGAIFRGEDQLLGRPVAVKVLHPHLVTAEARRFQREGLVLARLSHPNLAAVYDVDAEDGLPYLVMEFVEGKSLAELIGGSGVARIADGIGWATQVCLGLQYAHEHEVIHRDIKPQNILVTASGHVKIVDFGIARVPHAAEMTAAGWVLGTAQYLAPEVAAGAPATIRSDLYSLGVVLYRLFTGRLPFEGDDPLAVAMRHRSEPVPPPSEVRDDLPPALEEVLLRLLEKVPEDRYPSAAAVAQALAGVRT